MHTTLRLPWWDREIVFDVDTMLEMYEIGREDRKMN